MPLRLSASSSDFEKSFSDYISQGRELGPDVTSVVSEIIEDVRARGDAAVAEYTQKFDRLDVSGGLRIDPELIASASEACDADQIAALEFAATRIRAFHERQFPEGFAYTDAEGVRLGTRWTAVSAAGIYVPGGSTAYPSSVLMNAVPAKVAGVPRVVMVVPTPDGVVNPLVLAAADLSGVSEIYRIGGAQAVGALAYGTETVLPVDKITGPGNAYVAEAKRQVFGAVGIDMIAGPSEILVVADAENDAEWIAADLLSQAEHDAFSQSVLITDSGALADAVADAAERQLATLARSDIARRSWDTHGAIILVANLKDAVPLVDRLAPEHLELAVAAPDALAEKITHAGAIFLGRYTPEAIGDYVAGPNHVLPTARSARFSSGLGVTDFMKRTTMVSCDADSLARIGPAAVTLAGAEGLDAHALSLSVRLDDG
ncbi:MAG: histidinol dehydrogenase [Flammeovirgaceae bacterium TMED32]|nr:histidinol dehydrogenase [Rhodospirillaceae bacterium]OUT97975.1 MAG: histidinol dehydrogenase [Flammeovirgaceae bacterium TMED32]